MSQYNKSMIMLCIAAFCTNFIEWGYVRIFLTCLVLYGVYYFHNKYKDGNEDNNDDNYMRYSGSYYDDSTSIINKYLNIYDVIVVYYRNYNKTFICRKDEDGSIWQRQIDTINPKQKYFIPEFPMDDLIIYRPRDNNRIHYDIHQGEGGSGGGAYNINPGSGGSGGGSYGIIYTYNNQLNNPLQTHNDTAYNQSYLSKDNFDNILKRYQSDPITKETLIDIFTKIAEYDNLSNTTKEEK